MEIITLIGLGAAALSTISLLPQLIRVWRTKSVKDLSTVWCGVSCTSVMLWLTYGILARDMPLISSNSVVLLQTIAIFALKAKYGSLSNGNGLPKITSKIRLRKGPDNFLEQADTEIPFLL